MPLLVLTSLAEGVLKQGDVNQPRCVVPEKVLFHVTQRSGDFTIIHVVIVACHVSNSIRYSTESTAVEMQ